MTRTPALKLVRAEVCYGDFADPASLDRAFAGVTKALMPHAQELFAECPKAMGGIRIDRVGQDTEQLARVFEV